MSDPLNGTEDVDTQILGARKRTLKIRGYSTLLYRSHDVIRVDETDAWHHIDKHDISPSPFLS